MMSRRAVAIVGFATLVLVAHAALAEGGANAIIGTNVAAM